ncbi:MAG TPA: hypothetical protein VND91_01730 [Candidatus Saccharimonadia bacterium]|nr:hypothetical protein [Candidatus Saccharimonadia bacterium]
MAKSDSKSSRASGNFWGHAKKVDIRSVRARVAAMKREHPRMSRDTLHRKLVHAKCLQAGMIGAVSGMAGLVPVFGRVAQTLLGPLADAALVTTLQAELVAETLAIYDVELPEHVERMALMAVAATNIGAAAVSKQAARAVTYQAARLIGGSLARRALPIAGIVTTAAANIGVTYLIGMRAEALAKIKDAPIEDWPDLIRGVTSLDERRLARWAADAARAGIEQVADTATGWLAKLNSYVKPLIPGTRHSTRVVARKAGTRARKSPRKAARPAEDTATATRTPAAKRATANAATPRKPRARRARKPPAT